jgi:hypothetical protein
MTFVRYIFFNWVLPDTYFMKKSIFSSHYFNQIIRPYSSSVLWCVFKTSISNDTRNSAFHSACHFTSSHNKYARLYVYLLTFNAQKTKVNVRSCIGALCCGTEQRKDVMFVTEMAVLKCK